MKKKLASRRPSKLTLSRETLAMLDPGKMAEVNGGVTLGCTHTCPQVSYCVICND
jgi:hypothetical protein